MRQFYIKNGIIFENFSYYMSIVHNFLISKFYHKYYLIFNTYIIKKKSK